MLRPMQGIKPMQMHRPKQSQKLIPNQRTARMTGFRPLTRPVFAFAPINPQKTLPVLGFPFPPPQATRKKSPKSKTRKRNLDSKLWKVPKNFLVGFGSKVESSQHKFWGGKDQLGKGYKRRGK